MKKLLRLKYMVNFVRKTNSSEVPSSFEPSNYPDIPHDLAQLMLEYSPERILASLESTSIQNVYACNEPPIDRKLPTAFLVIGASAAGKDTILDQMKKGKEISIAVTGTTRDWRGEEIEPYNSYIWMRKRNPGESVDDYHKNLIEEYGLIESDAHDESVYGLPMSSLQNIPKNSPLVVRTDSAAVQTLRNALYGQYNVISIFVTPPNWGELLPRVFGERKNPIARLESAVRYYANFNDTVNFALVNQMSDDPKSQLSGLELSKASLRKLLAKYKS